MNGWSILEGMIGVVQVISGAGGKIRSKVFLFCVFILLSLYVFRVYCLVLLCTWFVC